VYIHDGKLLFALTQLAVKLYHLDPRRQKRKVMWKTTKLAERIWKCSRELQTTEESGWVGEALGVSGPLEKEGFRFLNPALLGPCESRERSLKNRLLPRPQTPGRRTIAAPN
jgi:hypothetical protein